MQPTLNPNQYEQTRRVLESAENGQGKLINKQPVVVKSTLFYNPSSTITDGSFFTNSALDAQWQSKDFPSTINLYRFTHVRIADNIQFTVSNALRYTQTLWAFIQGSSVNVKNNGDEVVNLPLARLTQYKFIPANNTAGTTAPFLEVKENFNNEYKLSDPITFNAGENPEITFLAAKGLTTAAWTANIAPVITGNTGGTLTTATEGFPLVLEFRGYKAKPIRQ